MFIAGGPEGSRRRALRASVLALLAALGVLTVMLLEGSAGPPGSAGHQGPARPGVSQGALLGDGDSFPEPTSTGTTPGAAQITLGHASFRIAGSVAGLYPGFTKVLVLTVTNPQFFRIVVTSITTTVKGASSTCLASNLSVKAFSGQLSVPGRGSAKVSVPASLALGAPDACIGATFPLSFHGVGRVP
jgi:hypothetical protein